MNNKSITGIILAAGSSLRYSNHINKNFEKIDGKTILSYSLNAFNNNEYINEIIVAIKESEIDIVKNIIYSCNIQKNIKIVYGGRSRSESVLNCLKSTCSDIVVIHDGARPLIKQKYINDCIENMKEFNGVTIGIKAKDTIKIVDDDNIVISTTIRSNTYLIQTPQCFNRKVLLDAYKEYKNEYITDDCMLLEMNGYKVKIIEGDYTNIKITTKEDLNIIKEYLTMISFNE